MSDRSRQQAVEVLTRVDMGSLIRAIEVKDLSVIRMADGTVPTQGELDLIKSARRADYDGAAAIMRAQAEMVTASYETTQTFSEVSIGLIEKYKVATLGEALALATMQEREAWLTAKQEADL